MPEGHWEILAQQYELIAILDEVIESEFAFAISAPNEPHYPTVQRRSEKFVISSIHRVTAKISRFLKVPDEIEDPIDASEERLSFYLTANVEWTEDLFDISEDALIAPVRLPCSGDILLIQMTHSPWHDGYSIAPYLNETVGGEHEQDIVEGIRTWNERSNNKGSSRAEGRSSDLNDG